MLTSAQPDALAGLDLSLQPVGDALKRALSSIHVQATVPTPVGPINLDSQHLPSLRNVSKAVANTVRNTRVEVSAGTTPPQATTPIEQAHQFVTSNVPGGWLTVIAVGIGGALAIKALMGSGKRGRR